MTTLDCRAHKCPHPVVETRKLILRQPGIPLQVLVGDQTARENVTRLADSLGYRVESDETEGGYALNLTPELSPQTENPTPPATGKIVILVGADTMGSGDDELGRLLMKNYLFTLTELSRVPDALFFVNSGVKLTAAGSETLEALEKLACMGADVASCGLCLDFFHLKERLAIGRTTNMLDIAESLQSAGQVIRP